MIKTIQLLSLGALLLSLAAWYAPNNDTWRDKISPELLAEAEAGGTPSFIVLMRDQADVSGAHQLNGKLARGRYVTARLQATALRSQRRARAILQEVGAAHSSFFVVNALHARGNLALMARLAQLPEVANLQPNAPFQIEEPMPYRGDDGEIGSREGVEWGIERIRAQEVWALGFTGQGVTVAGADTGVEWQHPAIRDQYRGWDGAAADHSYNWFDGVMELSPLHNDTSNAASNNPCGLSILVPCDDHNHGTHTVGTMAGGLSDQDKNIGVAPGARWIACRNMERGWGSPATYIACFEWMMLPTDSQGNNPDLSKAPHVINNSWGCPAVEGCNPDNWAVMQTVIENVKASGIVVVVSAGNSGPACGSVSVPAAMYEASFTVGATRQNDTIANFSSRGVVSADSSFRLKPDIAAPGVGVRSAIRNGNYASWNGTSMAGPHVAGLVALMISANPQLAGQVEVIEDIIEATAMPMQSAQDCGGVSGLSVPNAVYGHGRIDAFAAVEAVIALIVSTDDPTKAPALQVQPNPVSDWLYLSSATPLPKGALLTLFDAAGKQVAQAQWPEEALQHSISMAHLASGLYFYRLSAGGQLHTGKVIKAD